MVDPETFERLVQAVENDPDYRRLILAGMVEGDDPELGYSPILVEASNRSHLIIEDLGFRSNNALDYARIDTEARKRIIVR